jgi:hypothetical protein
MVRGLLFFCSILAWVTEFSDSVIFSTLLSPPSSGFNLFFRLGKKKTTSGKQGVGVFFGGPRRRIEYSRCQRR